MSRPMFRQCGFSLLELLLSLAIATLLVTGLAGVVGGVLTVQDDTQARNAATREARFAMQRMVTAIRQSDRLLLPLADNPATNWREHVREQTNPPSPPEGASTLATAVLAVTLGPILDSDEDGFADADNDKDGRVDEDVGNDSTDDGAAGVRGIDDDGDGATDEGNTNDDDEDGLFNEDHANGGDDDGDGSIGEDLYIDMNYDGEPGLAGVDDDGDGAVDEGNFGDDDEDGQVSEDWFDPVVFFLSGTTLMERRPDLNSFWGGAYTEYPIAESVSRFRVERIPDGGKRALLVELTLELTSKGGDTTSLSTRIRVGGGQ